MDQMSLVRRAFEITRRYPVLWIFGVLLALTGGTGGSSSGGGGGNNFNYRLGNQDWQNLGIKPGMDLAPFIGLIALCCLLLLVAAVVAVTVHYVSRVALYRMVDRIEATGEAPGWREGFRLGWSNRTFRLFLLSLLAGLAFLAALIVLLALAASPLLLLLLGSPALRVLGIALAVMLGLLVILLAFAALVALSALEQFWAREIALADRSIGQAVVNGYAYVRSTLKDVGVFYLLMTGIRIGFAIVMVPIFLALAVLAVATGGGLGLAIYAASRSLALAVLAGLPVGLLILALPLAAIGGLYEVFDSSAWTLAYREVVLRGRPQPA